MSLSNDATAELVRTLIDQTASGRIHWEPADAMGTAFIARRPSGTVAVEKAFFGSMGAELVIRDQTGSVLQRISAVSGFASPGLGSAAAAAGIPTLVNAIREQQGQKDEKIRRLAQEFRN